jgi:hypothetical protein
MAGLVPAIHRFSSGEQRRECPAPTSLSGLRMLDGKRAQKTKS